MSGPAAGDGDFQEAFPGLFLTAYHVSYRVLGDVTRAEDAAAEALARTLVSWRRVGRLEHRSAWVARVAGNVAIDEVRRLRRRRERPVETGGVPADTTEEATLRLALGAALAGLSTRQREVIALRYLADLDEAEVSRALGISVNSGKKHAMRGKAALRARLGTLQEVSLALD
jgi:RNA polymerase sigma-70 factor (ECF subfamily)